MIKTGDVVNQNSPFIYECKTFLDDSNMKVKKMAKFEDILMIWNTSLRSVGKVFLYLGEKESIVGSNFVILKHQQNPRYLFHVLNSPLFQRQIHLIASRKSRKWGVVNLNFDDIKNISIPIPPMEVQEQIAKELNELLFSENKLYDSLEKMLEIRKKQYEFYKEQLLTSEMDKWDIKTIEEIAVAIYTGKEVRKDQLGTGNDPAVKCGDINNKLGIFFKECVCFVDANLIHKPKYFEYGDILISQVGHSKQEAGIVTAYLGNRKGILGGAVHVVKHNQHPQFLSYMLSSKYCRKQIELKSVGGDFVNFTIRELKKIKVPLPPLETQERISQTLEKLDNQITQLEKDIQELTITRQNQRKFLTTQVIN